MRTFSSRMLPCLAIAVLFLAGACRQRGAQAQEPSAPVTPAPEVQAPPRFVPEFTASEIPPEVEARMRGNSYPEGATIGLDQLRYLRLSFIGFDGIPQTGEMVCNATIAEDLLDIFIRLYDAQYPIRSIRLVDDFGGSDDESMKADNTSCFNYRTVPGQKNLSRHALGLAVDVNPLENPYIDRNGVVRPPEGQPYVDRSLDFPHKITRDDLCCRLFLEHGFTWGGSWSSQKDYQHFDKR
jgi:hypothetical protein